MKRILILLLLALSLHTVSAQDFEILYLTTPTITIGNKKLKQGDTFPGNATVSWESPRQAMKVLNLSTNKQTLIVAEKYKETESKDLTSYFAATKQLTVRNGASLNAMELGAALNGSHYLLDSISVETVMPVDIDRFFYASYPYESEIINKKLETVDGYLIFDRSIFTIDGVEIEPFDVTLKVWYVDNEDKTKTLVTDNMILLPL